MRKEMSFGGLWMVGYNGLGDCLAVLQLPGLGHIILLFYCQSYLARSRCFWVWVAMCLPCSPVMAHPIPQDTHDRTITVFLTPDAVLIEYYLEVDEVVATADLLRVGESTGASSSQRFAAYLRFYQEEIQGRLRVDLDGHELTLESSDRRSRLGEHVYLTLRYRARWTLNSGSTYSFRFYEGNFPAESKWWVRMNLLSSPELTLLDERVPDNEKSLSNIQRRTISARVQARPAQLTGVGRGGLVPDADPIRSGARGRARHLAGKGKTVPEGFYGDVRLAPVEQTPVRATRLVDLLFEGQQGFAVLLLLAAGFGAVHALMPGHGKTVVAAFLIARGGTVWQAVLLGLLTALTHSAVVLAAAASLPFLIASARTAETQAAVEIVGGLMLTGVGCLLFIQRLTGRAGCIHSHDQPEGDGSNKRSPGRFGNLIVLGVGGGLIPCWDAVALLMLAMSTHRLWLGLPLLLAFSAGLSAVLVTFGVLVVRWGNLPPSGGRLARLLPVLAALVVLGAGLWLCYSGAQRV